MGNRPESLSDPEFSNQEDASRSASEQAEGDLKMTEPPTLEELFFPPGSHFRLVALEDLFPTETGGGLLEANLDRADNQSAAPLTGSAEARHVLLHEFELTDQVERIGNRKRYQLVAHVAWIQPGYAQDDAIAFPLADLAGVASGLQGDITLYLSRYLHMQFNLTISEPGGAPEQEPTTAYDRLVSQPMAAAADQFPAPSPVYRMDEKRRMRSGELHYIDHPYFGALARVTKVDPAFLAESVL